MRVQIRVQSHVFSIQAWVAIVECVLCNRYNFMVLFSKLNFKKETKYAHLNMLCNNILIPFLKPSMILWNLPGLLLYIMLLSSNTCDFGGNRFCWSYVFCLRLSNRYLKNSVLKSIVHVTKLVNLQLYRYIQ